MIAAGQRASLRSRTPAADFPAAAATAAGVARTVVQHHIAAGIQNAIAVGIE